MLVLELAAATMPVYLFNDLFAYTTIDISEKIFVVMEEKASIWRSVCYDVLFSLYNFSICLATIFSIREKCIVENVQR